MQFRHEWKHCIGPSDYLALRHRLRSVLSPDTHANQGRYHIRSLYFDNLEDKALLEKLYGVNNREKFRIRCYNHRYNLIRLEKKSKINGLCSKQSALLTPEQTQQILQGDMEWMVHHPDPLLVEFYSKAHSYSLLPKTVVDYDREPFVFAPGNVRVTLDSNIRTGLTSTDFLNPQLPTLSAAKDMAILEVKYDAFLPDLIRDLVQLDRARTTAFSKYAACRIYG